MSMLNQFSSNYFVIIRVEGGGGGQRDQCYYPTIVNQISDFLRNDIFSLGEAAKATITCFIRGNIHCAEHLINK